MKFKFLISILFIVLVASGCSSNSNAIDNSPVATEPIVETSEVETPEKEYVTDYNSFTIPPNMCSDVYDTAKASLKILDSFLNSEIDLSDSNSQINDCTDDLILFNKTDFSNLDQECYDNLLLLRGTLNRLYEKDFSEFTEEQLISALPVLRENLINNLSSK